MRYIVEDGFLLNMSFLCHMPTEGVCDHPPVHHPLGTDNDSVVDEPQPSYEGSIWVTYPVNSTISPFTLTTYVHE
jgi:hypothetical protein